MRPSGDLSLWQDKKAKGKEIRNSGTHIKKTSAVFRKEATFSGVLGFSPLVLKAQTSAAHLKSSLSLFFKGSLPYSIHPQNPELQNKNCTYNGCIICQI